MPEPEIESLREKYDIVKILLIIFLAASSLLNGYSYFKIMELDQLKNSYMILYNRTITIEQYYNESNARYLELRGEYEYISSNYNALVKRYTDLVNNYDDIMNYRLSLQLETSKLLTLPPKSNTTLIYEIPFSGYIEVSFSATSDVYLWIGSSSLENIYYSRYPPFPQTSYGSTFTVPVMPDVHVNFGNGSEFSEAEIEFSIKFVY